MIFEGDGAVFLREKIKHSPTVHNFFYLLKNLGEGGMVFKIGGGGQENVHPCASSSRTRYHRKKVFERIVNI